MRPDAFDYVILAVLLLAAIVDWRIGRTASQGALARKPGARVRFYRSAVILQWLATSFVLAVWIARGRPWSALWLGSIAPWRLSIGIAVAAAAIAFFLIQMRKVQKALARPKAVARLREQFAFADPPVPETSGERRDFWQLSLTAGICEEFLFRGFLMWLIAAWTNLILALIISSILFGCVHIYLGAADVSQAALIGLLFALVVVVSGSLWPAMVIHAATDLNAGEMGFRIAQAAAALPETAAPVAS